MVGSAEGLGELEFGHGRCCPISSLSEERLQRVGTDLGGAYNLAQSCVCVCVSTCSLCTRAETSVSGVILNHSSSYLLCMHVYM